MGAASGPTDVPVSTVSLARSAREVSAHPRFSVDTAGTASSPCLKSQRVLEQPGSWDFQYHSVRHSHCLHTCLREKTKTNLSLLNCPIV